VTALNTALVLSAPEGRHGRPLVLTIICIAAFVLMTALYWRDVVGRRA